MKILGVTGPSGAGKSVFCSALAGAGCVILDCDEIYHGLISWQSECVKELTREENFGAGILDGAGGIDRRKLGAIVFSPDGKEKLLKLNEITHRHVTEYIMNMLKIIENAQPEPKAVVIDAPLLFQSGIDKICTKTVALLAGRDTRLARLQIRDGIETERLEARLNAAPGDSYYTERAGITVINDGTPEELGRKALGILDSLTQE